jgi:hypothetical protein
VNKKLIFVYFAVIALVLGACSSPWKGDEGIFSVSIGGQSRTAWNATETLEELTHTITLSDGPGPEQIRENVKYGDTVHFSVTPGRWTISVTAFLDEDIYATGFARNVNIKPGPNGAITIKMEPVTSGEPGGSEEPGGSGGPEEPKEIIEVTNGNDDEGEGSLRWAMLNSPEVATIIIKKDVDTIIINKTLPALSFEKSEKSITIKAESEVTIKRGSNCLDQLFSVGGGGTLILGGGDSKPITIDGNNINAQTSLIDLGGPGAFIMNDGVTLKNNKNNGPNGGGGVAVLNGGTFTMNGGTISGNTATFGGGVALVDGNFIMKGGEISGNTANSPFTDKGGGGVFMQGGTFTMSGGTIGGNEKNKGNIAGDNGGGVYVFTGKFIMSGGEISGNSAGCCDGVYVESGSFIMSGGEISRNVNVDDGKTAVEASTAYTKYGILNADGTDIEEPKGTLSSVLYAIKIVNGIWTFDVANEGQWVAACEEIRGGNNDNNYAINVTGEGFAVDASSDTKPTFGWNKYITITGIKDSSGSIPTISLKADAFGSLFYIVRTPPYEQIVTIENIILKGKTSNDAPLVKIDRGTLIMQNGSVITGNTNSSNGGGVYIENEGNFVMNGNAKVYGNTAINGGGVAISEGLFIMNNNSEVSGNTATNNGGGVAVESATFRISGGTVKDNIATSNGSALYVKAGGYAQYDTEEGWTNFELTDDSFYDSDITVENGVLQP